MFDIDKYLGEIRLSEVNPSEDLVERTKRRCAETQTRAGVRHVQKKHVLRAVLIALPAAAVIAVGVFLGLQFLAFGSAKTETVAYYTIDINPSVGIGVNADGEVTEVVGQNDDAKKLLDNVRCEGKPVSDAIRQIVAAAQAAGYFQDGERYVLVGCFGVNAQGAVGDLQTQLEAEFGDMVDLLIVSGTLEDKHAADALSVSAGLLKLSQLAGEEKVSADDKVGEVMNKVTEVNQPGYCTPALSVAGDAEYLRFSWSEMDFDEMGYVGKVRYHIVAADSAAEISAMNARTLGTVAFYTYGAQTTSIKLKLSDCGITPGVPTYYGICAEYGGVTVAGSVVQFTLPEAEATPAPAPSETESPGESATPPASGHTVSGRVSGDNVVLTWDKDTTGTLAGYKVVASRNNASPSYPADGYLKYITNAGTTSVTLYEGYGDLKGNTFYYFSITYLYEDGTSITGNAVRLKVPEREDGEEPSETPSGDYVSTNISGDVTDAGKIRLSWGKVTCEGFEGYKVMYSFSDSTPVYGEGGCDYVRWITEASTTSCSFYASEIGASAGQTVYFSITVLYESHSVKKAGNTVSLTIPESEEPSSGDYVSTNISGSITEEGKIRLSWGEVTCEGFEGYKVMYSFSDSTPVYGESGCDYVRWITDASTTGCSFYAADIGASPGQRIYFSITVLYESHSVKKAGNAISLVVPGAAPEESTSEESDT